MYFKDGVLNIANMHVSKNCFDVSYIPDCLFNEVTLLVGNLNARHRRLRESSGNENSNSASFFQLLMDRNDAILLGTTEATHIRGERLSYAS